MNILITGGAGFIGANLASHHIALGDRVVVVDDLSSGRIDNLDDLIDQPRFHLAIADLLEWEDLGVEVARADRIYHLAAVVGMFRVLREPTAVMRVNVGGTERLLEAAADCGSAAQIIIASSSSVYGHHHPEGELREDDVLTFLPEDGGLAGYALSKLTNEIQARAYHREYGLQVIMPRFFNVAGPRQTGTYGFVIPRFIRQALTGEPLSVFGDGTQVRSFCDVRDVIRALELLAGIQPDQACAVVGQVFNLGNDREISILDLARMVIERSGSDSDIEFVPFDQAYGEHFDHITQRRPDLDKLQRLTGYVPQWSLEDTIDDLIKRHSIGGLSPCVLT